MKPLALTCLLSALCLTTPAPAQNAQTVHTKATLPVAFVYVSSSPGGGMNFINAYAAAANGKLTLVPGSPFHASVTSMAVNGKYLFGANKAGVYVAAFLMHSNGSLHWTTSTNVYQYNNSGCIYSGDLILDHTGANLYFAGTDGGLCDHTLYQAFKINSASGYLQFLGNTPDSFLYNTPLTFSGNNVYAYGTDCIDYQGGYLDTFTTYKRQSNGALVATSISAPTPAPPSASDIYCRSLVAADPANHLALVLQAIDNQTSSPDGLPQLASYTAAANGNLSTTSTHLNMPTTAVGYPMNLAMSPSGKLLAIGGSSGLQIFHFNAGSPLTHYTGLITGADIEQAFWDNANHLFAISTATHKLYVFTITPTSVSQAPGSPYTIANPKNIIVQPRTK